MKLLHLIRFNKNSKRIFGSLIGLNFSCSTLELGEEKNAEGYCCIPKGEYIIKRDHTGNHKVYRFQKVEGHENIEIHIANYPSELKGCVALGLSWSHSQKPTMINSSTNACNEFLKYMNDEDGRLIISDFNDIITL